MIGQPGCHLTTPHLKLKIKRNIRESSTSLRKHVYSNIFLQPKKDNFQIKFSDIFHISVQNIDSGFSLEPPRRVGSNKYPQSMFFSKIREIMYTPVNPSFTIKSGV